MATPSRSNGCCTVAPPRDDRERAGLLVGGILNIVLPFGIGALVCACMTGRSSMAVIGLFQFILSFLLVGAFWSLVYGILMLVANSAPPPSSAASEGNKEPSTQPEV